MPVLEGFGRNAARPSGQQVQTFGGPSAYSFGLALNDYLTPTGQSFGAIPADWPMPAGTGPWFGVALPDGNFAFGSMALTDSELQQTMYQTTLFIWYTAAQRLQAIAIPTTTGALSPPNVVGTGSSGNTVDMLRAVTISGVNYIFAVGLVNYGGWQIARYGEPYFLMAFKETAGVWGFDPTHSFTARQLSTSSTAGASAFPTAVNSFGETYYHGLGPACLILMPQSQDLLWGGYIFATGTRSGSITACNPSTGLIKGFFQYPDITDVNSVPVELSVRDLVANPMSSLGDERFIMTPDVFAITSFGPPVVTVNYGLSPLMEMTYNSSTGAITLLSTPMTPYTVPGQGYNNDYNLAQYDAAGNLWCPTHGGTGLAVFHGREMHFFEASGGNIPTFENGGPAVNWYAGAAGQFPTVTKADFRFGSFALPNGFDCSVNYDSARGRMLLLDLGGSVIAATLASTLALGSELAVNGTLSTGTTTGWNGLVGTSTIAVVADSDFSSGKCLELTSVTGVANGAAQAPVSVAPNQNFIMTGKVKAVVTARNASALFIWSDVDGNQTTTVSPVVTETGTTITYIECLAASPANAVSLIGAFSIVATTVGEQQKVGDLSIKTAPATTTASVDTNRTRVINGGSTFPNKGDIIGNHLYFTMVNLIQTLPIPVGLSIPQWLTGLDLRAVA